MDTLVIDCSVTMAWCFEDEAGGIPDAVLARLKTIDALVPIIWPLEVANALLVGERRKRLTQANAVQFLTLLRGLGITVDSALTPAVVDAILALARQHNLSAYDAAYLELALRHRATLCTVDDALGQAATASGVAVFRG